MSIEENYHSVRMQIQKSAHDYSRSAPTLIAVSKYQPIASIRTLYDLGHRDFGENYVQELVEKSNVFKTQGITDIRWHFIGHLQKNKAKLVIQHSQSIHSVDSIALAASLDRACSQMETENLKIWLQVNLDAEESKSGFSTDQIFEVIPEIQQLKRLKIQGLMCIPKLGNSDSFRRIQQLDEKLSKTISTWTPGNLSMGMSSDYEAAIANGAQWIRIGTSIFGSRPDRNNSVKT